MPSYYSRDPQDEKEVPQKFIEEAKTVIRDDILNCLPGHLWSGGDNKRYQAILNALENMLDEMDLRERAAELWAEHDENEKCEKADRDREEMKERERLGY